MSIDEKTELVRKALAELLSAKSQQVTRITWRLVGGNDALAKDVIQDACVRCIEEAGQLKDLNALEAWFFRILVNCAHNRHRRHRTLSRAKALFSHEARQAQHPTDLPDHGLQRRIKNALWTLRRSQREAFILVRLERLSVRESAAIMNVSEQAIRNHLHRAEQALKLELGDLREPVEERNNEDES